MINNVDLLKSERTKLYDTLVKNSKQKVIHNGYCPECKEELHKEKVEEKEQNPQPTSDDVKPSIYKEEPHIIHNEQVNEQKEENNNIIEEPLFL